MLNDSCYLSSPFISTLPKNYKIENQHTVKEKFRRDKKGKGTLSLLMCEKIVLRNSCSCQNYCVFTEWS